MSKEVTANNYETNPTSSASDCLTSLPEDIRNAESLSKFKGISSLTQYNGLKELDKKESS